jgi:tryptophan-rich sensory protein
MNEAAPVRRCPRVLSFWFSIALTMAVSAIGGLATARSLDSWYAGLNKPSFNPPNWMFAPVWTTLYILMAIAGWRIYLGPESRSRRAALTLLRLATGAEPRLVPDLVRAAFAVSHPKF